MGSLHLNSLTPEQRKNLEKRLHSAQHGSCFICEKQIDLLLHADAIVARPPRRFRPLLFANPAML